MYQTNYPSGSSQRVPESVSSPGHAQKRASLGTHPLEQPAKKQSKWSQDENRLIIQLRGENMKWEEISKRLPGRSAISCRLHYQNFLERKAEWTDEREAKLARLYDRFKKDMWEKIAKEMQMPWRAVEAKHWEMGPHLMAKLAGANPFSTTSSTPTQEFAPLPQQMTTNFSADYQPSSLRHPYDPYGSDPSSGIHGRGNPMEPPPRPEHLLPHEDHRYSLQGGQHSQAQFPRHQSDFPSHSLQHQHEHGHSYGYPHNDRHLPPLEGQQLPPMRLLTEPRHSEHRSESRSPYSG